MTAGKKPIVLTLRGKDAEMMHVAGYGEFFPPRLSVRQKHLLKASPETYRIYLQSLETQMLWSQYGRTRTADTPVSLEEEGDCCIPF